MFTELKESMIKEVKEGIMIFLYQIENINRERWIIKKNQIKILELESTVTEIKNLPEGLKVDSNWQKKAFAYLKIDW